MANDNIYIYDHNTGEEIIREMTAEEQTQRDAEVAAHQAQKELKKQALAEAQAKRQALLAKLGLSEEEAKLLLGGN